MVHLENFRYQLEKREDSVLSRVLKLDFEKIRSRCLKLAFYVNFLFDCLWVEAVGPFHTTSLVIYTRSNNVDIYWFKFTDFSIISFKLEKLRVIKVVDYKV